MKYRNKMKGDRIASMTVKSEITSMLMIDKKP